MGTTTQDAGSDNWKSSLGLGDHTVNLNGVDLHYRVCGDGPLLFVISPGWGIGSGYLQRGLGFLQERFRLVFVDTRGSGLSGRPADRTKMSSNDMADDLEALREHLGLSTLQLLGHSNSGSIALFYAARYLDRVGKLILVDSQMLGFSAGAYTQAFLEARAEDPRFKAAVQAAIGQFSGKGKPLMSDADLSGFVAATLPLFFKNPEENLALAEDQLLVEPISLYAFEAQNAADKAAQDDQTTLLEKVRASALVMVGRHDWICPVPVAERLHAGIGNARLVMFEDSGHFPWIEEPEKFAAELIRFLEE
jgi:proline iminopeptidase